MPRAVAPSTSVPAAAVPTKVIHDTGRPTLASTAAERAKAFMATAVVVKIGIAVGSAPCWMAKLAAAPGGLTALSARQIVETPSPHSPLTSEPAAPPTYLLRAIPMSTYPHSF